MSRTWALFGAIFLGLGSFACGGAGTNAAATQLKTPEMPTDRQAKCKVAKSQSEPLIVEWPDTARGKLESMSSRGLVAVRYQGCELEVLARCTVKVGKYDYTPVTRKQSRVTIKDEDELFASLPVGAVKLESKLKSAGQLNVQMTIVGRYEAPASTKIYREDLEGECSDATHVVAALTVGAFTFFAGADAEVGGSATVGVGPISGGGGGKSGASRELLQKDGDETACVRAGTEKAPPEGCGALLQIEVMPLAAGRKAVAVAPVPVPVPAPTPDPVTPEPVIPPAPTPTPKPTGKTKPPKCLRDEKLVGGVCVKKNVASNSTVKPPVTPPPEITCASGQHVQNNRCVDDPPPPCPSGTHREGSRECVEDYKPPPTVTEPDRNPTPQPYAYPESQKQTEVPNPIRGVLAYAAIGFGITWVIAGPASLKLAGEAKDMCVDATKSCSPEFDDKKKSAQTFAIIADVALGLTVASVVGIFLVPAHTKVGIAPTTRGASLGASGSF